MSLSGTSPIPGKKKRLTRNDDWEKVRGREILLDRFPYPLPIPKKCSINTNLLQLKIIWSDRLTTCCSTDGCRSSLAGLTTISSRCYGKCCWTVTTSPAGTRRLCFTNETSSCDGNGRPRPLRRPRRSTTGTAIMTSYFWNYCRWARWDRTPRRWSIWAAPDFTSCWGRSIPLWPTLYTRITDGKSSGKPTQILSVFFVLEFELEFGDRALIIQISTGNDEGISREFLNAKELTKSLSKSTRNDKGTRLMGGNKTIEPVGRNSFLNLAVPKFWRQTDWHVDNEQENNRKNKNKTNF